MCYFRSFGTNWPELMHSLSHRIKEAAAMSMMQLSHPEGCYSTHGFSIWYQSDFIFSILECQRDVTDMAYSSPNAIFELSISFPLLWVKEKSWNCGEDKQRICHPLHNLVWLHCQSREVNILFDIFKVHIHIACRNSSQDQWVIWRHIISE